MLELRWRYAPGIGSLRSISLLLVPVLTCLSPVSVSCASPMPSLCGTLCLLKNSSSLVLMRSTAERRVADRPAFLRWSICRRLMLDRFDCPPCCSPTNPLSTCPSRVWPCFCFFPFFVIQDSPSVGERLVALLVEIANRKACRCPNREPTLAKLHAYNVRSFLPSTLLLNW
jgi:hypothetical protein